jgi:D-alanine-D-alanine ligase
MLAGRVRQGLTTMLATARSSVAMPRWAAEQPVRPARSLQNRIETLKSRLRIAVIFGGNKLETDSVLYETQNSRSWKSYQAVAEDIAAALRRLGFAHVWAMPDDMNLGERLRREGIHLAWLNSGGVQGYNAAAHTAAMLEMMGLPYVGHDPSAATTLDNKHAFKRICPSCTGSLEQTETTGIAPPR